MTTRQILRLNVRAVLLLILATLGSAAGATDLSKSSQSTAMRPNVLVILADDLGYADLNINNPQAKSPTPHLNELAASGVRFTRHYTESTCSPSRAALLTGRYPARANYKPNGFGIPVELNTLPKAFKAAGYRTHQIGKWHLGHLLPEAWPDAQGFDTWLGFLNQWLMTNPDRHNGFQYGVSTHFDVYLQNEKGVIKQFPGHLTDVATDEAIRLIKNDKSGPPWFMYLAYFAPHEPIQPRADYAARFPDTPAGHYAAMVAHLDDRIADVLKTLDETGQRYRTIIVFASDNGGTNKHLDNNAPFVGKKTEYLEGGVRTPLLVSWPGKVPTHRVINQVVSIMDIYPTLAALAGVPINEKLDGRSLFNRQGSPIENMPPRSLYWEMGTGLARRYSVLSSDGRWRLYQDWLGDPSLFDLQKNPESGVNVAAAHADIVQRLHADYEKWETDTARISLTMQQQDTNGHGVLTGDRLQRAATFGDFTVAIGITPTKPASIGEQIILEQRSMLKITSDTAGLHIKFHEFSADLSPPPINHCSSLVITGTFNRKIEFQDFGASMLNIYLNTSKVKSIEQGAALLDSTNINTPTYIGLAENGLQRFEGTLSAPIYLNLRADSLAPASSTVSALSEQICPSSNDE
jgi:arylsulfatase A-like enzyme